MASPGSGQHPEALRSTLTARRYLFHAPGVTYAVTTVVLVLGAINGQNNLLFIIFGLAVGGLIVSGVLSGANLMGVHIDREVCTPAHAGEPVTLRYLVRNRNRIFPAMGLLIEELPAGGRWGSVSGLGRQSGRLAALLWKLGGLLRLGRGASERLAADERPLVLVGPPACALHVGAGGVMLCEAHLRGRRRGVVALRRFRVTSTFPFGITRKSVIFECKHEVEVFPARREVAAGCIPAVGSEHKARPLNMPTREGEEFFSLREHAPGDGPRQVAWRASARAGALRVKESVRRQSVYVLIIASLDGTRQEREESMARACSLAGACMRANAAAKVAIAATAAGSDEPLLLAAFQQSERHAAVLFAAAARLDVDSPRAMAGVRLPSQREGAITRVYVRGDQPDERFITAEVEGGATKGTHRDASAAGTGIAEAA